MDHRGKCNRAVVVSVAQFDPGVRLGRRPGVKRDAKRLHGTLSKLGFKVEIHTDLSSDEIYELFLKGTTHSLSWEHRSSVTVHRTHAFTLFIDLLHLHQLNLLYISCYILAILGKKCMLDYGLWFKAYSEGLDL